LDFIDPGVDELKNSFQVDDIDDGGGWEYRLLKLASDGTKDVDLTLVGIEGAFAPRRSSVPEPGTPILLGLALASLAFQLGTRARLDARTRGAFAARRCEPSIQSSR
jgi:hypothetical protein